KQFSISSRESGACPSWVLSIKVMALDREDMFPLKTPLVRSAGVGPVFLEDRILEILSFSVFLSVSNFMGLCFVPITKRDIFHHVFLNYKTKFKFRTIIIGFSRI